MGGAPVCSRPLSGLLVAHNLLCASPSGARSVGPLPPVVWGDKVATAGTVVRLVGAFQPVVYPAVQPREAAKTAGVCRATPHPTESGVASTHRSRNVPPYHCTTLTHGGSHTRSWYLPASTRCSSNWDTVFATREGCPSTSSGSRPLTVVPEKVRLNAPPPAPHAPSRASRPCRGPRGPHLPPM